MTRVFEHLLLAEHKMIFAAPLSRVIVGIFDGEYVVEFIVRYARESLDHGCLRRNVRRWQKIGRFHNERVAFPPSDRIAEIGEDRARRMFAADADDAGVGQLFRMDYDDVGGLNK